jgi:outer membrane protein
VKTLSGERPVCGRMNKRIISIVLLIIIGGFVAEKGYPQDIRIGIVDIPRAVNECNAGKEAKRELAIEAGKLQGLIAQKQKELQGIKESLEKAGPLLSPEAREAREREYQIKLRDYQRWGEDSQREFNQKRVEMENKIAAELQKLIQRMGADEGYTLILDSNENIVLFSSKSIDLTDRMIKAYDAQKK